MTIWGQGIQSTGGGYGLSTFRTLISQAGTFNRYIYLRSDSGAPFTNPPFNSAWTTTVNAIRRLARWDDELGLQALTLVSSYTFSQFDTVSQTRFLFCQWDLPLSDKNAYNKLADPNINELTCIARGDVIGDDDPVALIVTTWNGNFAIPWNIKPPIFPMTGARLFDRQGTVIKADTYPSLATGSSAIPDTSGVIIPHYWEPFSSIGSPSETWLQNIEVVSGDRVVIELGGQISGFSPGIPADRNQTVTISMYTKTNGSTTPFFLIGDSSSLSKNCGLRVRYPGSAPGMAFL